MTPFTCAREKELTQALRLGHWPQACPPELRAHVAGCRTCSDLALVAGSLRVARSSVTDTPHLPSAGALWWRAQLRRRNADIERLARPLLGAQIFAMAMAVVVCAGVLLWAARQGFAIGSWFRQLAHTFDLSALLPDSLVQFGGISWLLIPVLATLALVSGVVVYFASEKQ